MHKNGMEIERFLEVRGSGYERGLQQGKFYAIQMNRLVETIREVFSLKSALYAYLPKGFYRISLRNYGKKYFSYHEKLLRDFEGDNLVEHLQGLADGFGQDKFLIYGVNAVEILASKIPFSLGCSSLAFSSDITTDGHIKTGYNHDFPAAFGKFIFLKRNLPDHGYPSLVMGYPPILGCIGGINQAGLAITLNHAYATDIKIGTALPITLLIQECLNRSQDVPEAIHLIEKTPVPNGSIVTLIDKKGNRAAAEISCTRKRYRSASSPILRSFNKYLDADMECCEIPLNARGKQMMRGLGVHDHNIGRENRYQQIIDYQKKYSDQDIRSLLADHNGGKGSERSICRHHSATGDTLCSAILDPIAQEIKIIFGFPCQPGEYQTFRL
ncbi:MAG: hypothetical protein HYU97_03600 [Deltaproteobacteria bacterium]|nr:hypothetical protein [Deltaproteobacteria bacterium]